jgi:two-component system NtrC family sensor kinase
MVFQSLRLKFMLIFFIFFLIPFGLLTFFSISISKQMMKKGTFDHLQNLVEVKETVIEQWIMERVRDGMTIAESAEIKSLKPNLIGPFLSLVKHFERAYLDIRIFNLKGQIISGSGERVTTSVVNEEWFQGALKDGVFIYLPKPALDEATPPQPTITIAVAIKDAEGHSIGVLKELVFLTYINELISESKLGKTGKLFIVHPQGQFVLHSRLTELLNEGTTKVSYFEKITPGESYTGVYGDYTGNEVLGSWKWIPNLRCYLIAEQETQEAFLEINVLIKNATLIFIISAFFILRISYWVIGNATAPIKRLSEAVALFAKGQFGKTVSVSTKRRDEIGKLVVGFNLMAEKLQKAYADLEGKIEASNKELEIAYQMLLQRQEQLIQSEKMAALGQLSAGIAHEVRNPLTSIKIFIQSLEKESGLEENQKEDFRIIVKEIDRINEHITLFLNFARPEDPLFQAINIYELVREPLNLLTAKLKNSGIHPVMSLADDHPPVEGDRKQLTQVVLNLMLNAVEAMPQGGTLTICSTVKVNPESRQEFLQLIVKDTGHGVPEKDRPHLFDPFFTTKAGGTGLGLSVAYSIIQKHNGRIEVESELGKGASFILSLPVKKEESWNEFSL